VFDDIAALFHENVVDSFTGYLDSRRTGKAGRSRDLRAAIAAATALYHFREHLPSTFPKSRADIVRECPDYSLLGDVVNASKHKELTRGSSQLESAEQIEERLVITEYRDEQGDYRHIEKRVVVKLTDGSERDLLEVMIKVMNFWQGELASLGLISARPSYVMPSDPQPRPRAECNDGRLDFELIAGLRFKQTFWLQRYNYATSRIEPVDVTGSSFEFRIYKPRYRIDISLKNERTGQELNRTIDLSEEESQQLLAHQSEQEKQQYFASLPQAQQALRELAAEARSIDASSKAGPSET
jgi:hypothetical protein